MDAKTIGSKITKARKEMKMSQAQLAQRLFISPQAIGKWERSESLPDIITISRLAEILGVDLNYFSESFQSTDEGATPKMNTEHTAEERVDRSGAVERPLLTNFSGSDLSKSDFAGVTAHKFEFNASALQGADFGGADLTGSSFTNSDMQNARFDGTNLTDCNLSVLNLTDASFSKSILVRTAFSKSAMNGVKFTDVTLTDVKMTMTDLRKTIFENCVFNGVDFEYCDFRGLCLDGQTFLGVKFDKVALNEATFVGATLKNVSFRASIGLTNKYYRSIKTIRFDGAMMDKLTYAALKGLGANLLQVTII